MHCTTVVSISYQNYAKLRWVDADRRHSRMSWKSVFKPQRQQSKTMPGIWWDIDNDTNESTNHPFGLLQTFKVWSCICSLLVGPVKPSPNINIFQHFACTYMFEKTWGMRIQTKKSNKQLKSWWTAICFILEHLWLDSGRFWHPQSMPKWWSNLKWALTIKTVG